MSIHKKVRKKLICCANIQHQKSLMPLDIEWSVKDPYRENCRFRDGVSQSIFTESQPGEVTQLWDRGAKNLAPHCPQDSV